MKQRSRATAEYLPCNAEVTAGVLRRNLTEIREQISENSKPFSPESVFKKIYNLTGDIISAVLAILVGFVGRSDLGETRETVHENRGIIQ